MQNKTVFSDIPNATELQDENTRYQQVKIYIIYFKIFVKIK